MDIHRSITPKRLLDAVELDAYLGFCVACGEEHDNCEPDASAYECYECGEHAVYGAEELLVQIIP